MAAPAQQHQPPVDFDPFHEHRTSEAPNITISPATSNKNLRFSGYTGVTTSLRSAFEGHKSFKAAFQVPVNCIGGIAFEDFDEEYKRPGRIVALSENCSMDMTTEEPKADRNEVELKGAKKGLISAIMTAYNKHCNLVISPDDVWLTVLAQFCAYVNRNAESLRGRIVEHEGKKELKVYSYGTPETADYGAMVRDMLGKIRENIKSPELADWFRPGFSTTTEREEVCAAATALASLQSYFDYRLMRMRCGIPTVTLMGTIEDWKLLREKVDRLLEFEVHDSPDGNVMELWVGYLRKVCDGFVESAEHPDSSKTLEFWDKVLLHRGGGSGPSYITGWLSAFTCFDTDGKFIGRKREVEEFVRVGDADTTRYESQKVVTEFPLINTDKISHNVVSCPVIINDDGVEYEGALVAGQVVFEVEPVKEDAYPTIRPRNDWCMTVAAK